MINRVSIKIPNSNFTIKSNTIVHQKATHHIYILIFSQTHALCHNYVRSDISKMVHRALDPSGMCYIDELNYYR